MGEFDGEYITLESVRRTCGIGSDVISDADVKQIIDECEPQVARFYNTKFTPTQKIETVNGTGTNTLILKNNPVLAVRDLYIDGTQIDPTYLNIHKGSGKIKLNSSAPKQIFTLKENAIVIKYIYGFLEESLVSTTTSADSIAGTDVELSVVSETDFVNGDWIEIYGMDGHRESAQVKSTSPGKIVVDQLNQTHVTESIVVKLQIAEIFKKLMNFTTSISMVARIVGQSYTDIVGYGLGEMHVQKGEPYTQWRETANQLIKERNLIMAKIKPRPVVM